MAEVNCEILKLLETCNIQPMAEMPHHIYEPHTERATESYKALNLTVVDNLHEIAEQAPDGEDNRSARNFYETAVLLANRGLLRYVLDGPIGNTYKIKQLDVQRTHEELDQLPALDRDDLLQWCCWTLIQKSLSWESGKGSSFFNYERRWLEQTARRTIDNEGRTIKLPVQVLEMVREYERSGAYHERLYYLDRLMIKDGTSYFPETVPLNLRADITESESDDSPIDEGHLPLVPDIPHSSHPITADQFEQVESTAMVAQLLKDVGARARQVMELRYGLTGRKPMAYDAIAQELGIHTQTVVRIENRTLQALRARYACSSVSL